jgi:uncharacterized protein with HEPN domain
MFRDAAYLLDMLIAARYVSQHVSELSYERFRASRVHQDAAVRQLEIIGEAARHVSETTRRQHAAIDWANMIGMRHRLAHDYRNVDLEVVWAVATHEIPPLIVYLEQVVPPE